MLKDKSARASYGVICRRLYNKNLHVGEDVVMDSFNKKEKWASSQIDWLIKKVVELSFPSCIMAAFS